MSILQSVKKGEELELTIDSMSFGGQGVARHDDMVIFVDGAVPGDTARVLITKKKKTFAEGRQLELVKPSEHRVTPVCAYVGLCGGCRMQDVRYDAQLEFKRQNVEDVFRRIGGFENMDVPTPLGSPDQFHYRNKMEFSFGDRPWLSDEFPPSDPSFALGLHIPRRFDKILDIRECHLHPPLWTEILNCVRDFSLQSGLPPYSVKDHHGFWRFLVLRRSVHTGEHMVQVITSAENADIMRSMTETLTSRFPEITSLINGISQKKAQIAVHDYELVLFGKDHLIEQIGSLQFQIASNAFFQTNTRGAEVLYDAALGMADFSGSESVLDLYCGTGTIALYVAPHVGQVIGYELVENAVTNARENADRNNINNCTFVAGDLRTALPENAVHADVVILDPPRAGLHPDVVGAVLKIDPSVILYISCNPSTQARDVSLFCNAGYQLTKIQPVDMFPHTYHIENIVRLERR